ncbi:AAA family ATPase [Polyangium mundeleinium]|uniref:AAA family ATPase n=1 Tax=Polyangium mundeleinium TaxID=2995306 RepID=A0ABT5F446_9BACT|nr:AAA family ATPase [Polyangium mundeleinium]MDC0747912.1 AAA family ATPase [Polyangium mundeleinium]
MVAPSAFPASAADAFDGYTSVVPVYEGAETFVYRARTHDSAAQVILKQTKNDYPSARELARLRREFMILRELGLDNTPQALALEEHGRGLRLVMADIGHPTLREVLEGEKLSIDTVLVLAISICNALAAIHERRVIHKDITPRNILVDTSTSRVFLIDFGISARISRELNAPTSARSLEGTPLYVSPGQTGRMNRAVDARSDLYSLGVILYEMLVGHVPFPDREVEDVIQAHLTRNPVPPREMAPSVPAPLSDIVMRLLAKTPEERYQSDAGLAFDLSECLRQWREHGSVDSFRLYTKDRAPELRRAQRLYGRERDIEALLQAFERARQRGPELVLVSGYSGIGKSALVREIHKTISRHGGYFISGKFDQLSRDVPLAPVAHAFRELMREILTEPPAALARWKEGLLSALKGNGALLTELVPELALIVGDLPNVPDLPPDQAKNRFELTLLDFLHVFASAAHPVVLFLDDLQWLDPASRRLLHILLTDAFSRHLLIIGAYRDNEVEPGHPLLSLVAELGKVGFRATEIQLGPLDRETLHHLVADTLTSRPEEVESLAELVYEKTHGNPFFLHQFLVTLNERNLLRFDPSTYAWSWEVDTIRAANVTDNVVDLLLESMQELPAATQQVLVLAACIGHSFDYGLLAIVANKPPGDILAAIWGAMKAGLIVSPDGDYRYLEVGLGGADASVSAARFDVRYRFVHDRVHQAAYLLLPPEQRETLHLGIGRLLQQHIKGASVDEHLLELVRHLNIGAACMESHAERADLAALNLRAAQRAKASTAYHASAEYARAGIGLLRDGDWDERYDLCLELYMLAGQGASLGGDAERAEVVFAELGRRVKTDIERAAIQRERVYSRISHGQFMEGVRIGLDTLGLLGHPLRMEEITSPQVMMAELAQVTTNLRGRRIEDVIDAPEVKDPVIGAVLSILDSIGDGSHHLGAIPFSIINLRAVNIALVHGHTELVALPYSCVGYMLAAIRGRVNEGMDFCKLAEGINAKFPSALQTARLGFAASSCAHMRDPMRQVGERFAVTRQRCLETGEFHMLGVACFLGTMANLFAGDQIDDVLDLAEKNLAIARRTKIQRNNAAMTAVRQSIACLAGKTRDATSFSDDNFDEDKFVRDLQSQQPSSTNVHYGVLKTFVLLVHGKHADAWEASEIAERALMFGGGTIQPKIHPFFRALLLLILPPPEEPKEAARRKELFTRYRAEIAELAAWSPKSFAHVKALVDAEEARTQGDVAGAMQRYESAIALCQENKAPHFEAMANELFAKFFVSIGITAGAGAYMRNAYRAYLHWGAPLKAASLESESSHIWPSPREVTRSSSSTGTTNTSGLTELGRTLLSKTGAGSLRDAALVVRAAQEIASEIDLAKVIDRLAQLVLSNAGADRGVLILARDGQFAIVARLGEGSSTIDVGEGEPLESAAECAHSVILYVSRTQEAVLLDDRESAARFANDPYLLHENPRSILCLPLLHQGRLSGVLYLENRTISGVFHEARVELLTLLSSQAAIAIEIASLIENSRAANEEVKRANERLELEVARRTEELRYLNRDLTDANVRLEAELSQRRVVEEQREALQAQIIGAQRDRLAELSTPLLPITREIVVMPLIGTMDGERAAQVLAVALEGAQRQGARMVILDVTGMKDVDTHVARMLLDVAGALRLLGAETLITGIAPRSAQTLISLDVDLRSFVTMSTLQSGMEYALRRVRGSTAAASAPRLRGR